MLESGGKVARSESGRFFRSLKSGWELSKISCNYVLVYLSVVLCTLHRTLFKAAVKSSLMSYALKMGAPNSFEMSISV